MDSVAYYFIDPTETYPKGRIWSVWEKKFIDEEDKNYADWKHYKIVYDDHGQIHSASMEEIAAQTFGGKEGLPSKRCPSYAPGKDGTATTESLLATLKFYNLPYPLSLEELKNEKLKSLNQACDYLLDKLTSTYPFGERETFYKQEGEAVAYKADPTSPCPCLQAIAKNRGIPLEVLVEKVLQKSALFAACTGEIIGERQKLEDELDLASTEKEVNALDEKILAFKRQEEI